MNLVKLRELVEEINKAADQFGAVSENVEIEFFGSEEGKIDRVIVKGVMKDAYISVDINS